MSVIVVKTREETRVTAASGEINARVCESQAMMGTSWLHSEAEAKLHSSDRYTNIMLQIA